MTGQRVALDSPILEEPHIRPELLAASGLIHQAHQIGNLLFHIDGFGVLHRIGENPPRANCRRQNCLAKVASVHAPLSFHKYSDQPSSSSRFTTWRICSSQCLSATSVALGVWTTITSLSP